MFSELFGLIVFLTIFSFSVFLLWQRLKSMRKEDGMIDTSLLHRFMFKLMGLLVVIWVIAMIFMWVFVFPNLK